MDKICILILVSNRKTFRKCTLMPDLMELDETHLFKYIYLNYVLIVHMNFFNYCLKPCRSML